MGQIGVGVVARQLDAVAAVGGRLDAPGQAIGPDPGRSLADEASVRCRKPDRIAGAATCASVAATAEADAAPAATAAALVVFRKSPR